MLKERMGWLNQRQNLLSQNVANVDTLVTRRAI